YRHAGERVRLVCPNTSGGRGAGRCSRPTRRLTGGSLMRLLQRTLRSRAALALVLGCCAATLPAQEPAAATGDKPALVVIVGGVGGLENLAGFTKWAVKNAGVNCEVLPFDWTHGKGHILKDLQDTRNHAKKTAELAEKLNRLHEADPDRPIFLIG